MKFDAWYEPWVPIRPIRWSSILSIYFDASLIVFLCSFLFYHSLSLEFGLFLVVTSVYRFVSVVSFVVSGVLLLPDSSL